MNERLRSTNAVVGVQLNGVSNEHARAQHELNDLRNQFSTLVGEFAQLNSARGQADTAVEAAHNTARTEELTQILNRERSRAAALAFDFARVQRLVSISQDENARLAKELADQSRAVEIQAAELRSALEATLLRAQSAEIRSEEAQRFVVAAQGQLTELSARNALAAQALAVERSHKEEILSRARELEQIIASGQEALRTAQAAHQVDKLEAQAELAGQLTELSARNALAEQALAVERSHKEEILSRARELEQIIASGEEALRTVQAAHQADKLEAQAELAGQRDALNAAESSKAAIQHERDQLAFQLKVQMPETLARILGKITKAEDTFERERKSAPRAITLHDPAAAAGLRDRYLDLLEGSLTGTLYEDAPMSPWSKGYDPEVRSLGRDWPERALTMIGTARMRNVRRVLEDVLAREVPGDFIETGVWRGGACIYARGIFAAYGARDRKVWVADSFNGLPPPSPDMFPEDRDDPHHTYEELRVSLNQVRQNFRDYGLLDDQVQFLRGWFSETLTKAPIERLSVLRLDGDMYESTIQALEALYRKVSVGGYVIVDDYGLGPCKKAVDTFRAGLGIEDTILEIDGAAIYWRKTGTAETVGDRKLASVPKQG